MSDLSEIKDIAAPSIKKFPLATGITCIIGPLSIQAMLDIEEEHGSFNDWAKRVTDPANTTLKDVASMMWALCINKDDFENQPRKMLTGFPVKLSWLKEVKIIMMQVITDSVDTEENTGDKTGKK